MQVLTDIALVAGAYLFGSIPHLHILARIRRIELSGDFHQDLWYRGGRAIAVIGVLGEFAKGIVPVLAGIALGFGIPAIALAGLAAVSGQMWPVFSRFDGEKGNSVAIAMVFTLVTDAALLAIIPVIIALIIRTATRLLSQSEAAGDKSIVGGSYSRSLPIGMAICFFILPGVCWYLGKPIETTLVCAALFILIMIRRLTAGIRIDLQTSNDTKGIISRRLLYDRATAAWRQ